MATGRMRILISKKKKKKLRGTSNRSGPDGISYRLIKMVLDTKLGRELITEVATSLKEGRIPSFKRRSLYPSRTKTTGQQRDGGRSISIASANWRKKSWQTSSQEAQGAYGGIKGRSALEAMTRHAGADEARSWQGMDKYCEVMQEGVVQVADQLELLSTAGVLWQNGTGKSEGEAHQMSGCHKGHRCHWWSS